MTQTMNETIWTNALAEHPSRVLLITPTEASHLLHVDAGGVQLWLHERIVDTDGDVLITSTHRIGPSINANIREVISSRGGPEFPPILDGRYYLWTQGEQLERLREAGRRREVAWVVPKPTLLGNADTAATMHLGPDGRFYLWSPDVFEDPCTRAAMAEVEGYRHYITDEQVRALIGEPEAQPEAQPEASTLEQELADHPNRIEVVDRERARSHYGVQRFVWVHPGTVNAAGRALVTTSDQNIWWDRLTVDPLDVSAPSVALDGRKHDYQRPSIWQAIVRPGWFVTNVEHLDGVTQDQSGLHLECLDGDWRLCGDYQMHPSATAVDRGGEFWEYPVSADDARRCLTPHPGDVMRREITEAAEQARLAREGIDTFVREVQDKASNARRVYGWCAEVDSALEEAGVPRGRSVDKEATVTVSAKGLRLALAESDVDMTAVLSEALSDYVKKAQEMARDHPSSLSRQQMAVVDATFEVTDG